MKRLLLAAIVALSALGTASAQSVIRGEVTPGVYQSVKVTAEGAMYTTPLAGTSNVGTTMGNVFDRSGVITTAGVSQQVTTMNLSRKYLLIQNTSDTDLWFNFTANATLGQPSIKLTPYGSFVMESKFISTEGINVISSVAGKSFSVKEF